MKPQIFQPLCSELIFFYLLVFGMIPSVYLYDKPLFDTNKVYDIITDNMLPIELNG